MQNSLPGLFYKGSYENVDKQTKLSRAITNYSSINKLYPMEILFY